MGSGYALTCEETSLQKLGRCAIAGHCANKGLFGCLNHASYQAEAIFYYWGQKLDMPSIPL